jgi:hypothetical protein
MMTSSSAIAPVPPVPVPHVAPAPPPVPMPVMGAIALPEPPPAIMGEMMVEMGDIGPAPELDPAVEPVVEINGKPSR